MPSRVSRWSTPCTKDPLRCGGNFARLESRVLRNRPPASPVPFLCVSPPIRKYLRMAQLDSNDKHLNGVFPNAHRRCRTRSFSQYPGDKQHANPSPIRFHPPLLKPGRDWPAARVSPRAVPLAAGRRTHHTYPHRSNSGTPHAASMPAPPSWGKLLPPPHTHRAQPSPSTRMAFPPPERHHVPCPTAVTPPQTPTAPALQTRHQCALVGMLPPPQPRAQCPLTCRLLITNVATPPMWPTPITPKILLLRHRILVPMSILNRNIPLLLQNHHEARPTRPCHRARNRLSNRRCQSHRHHPQSAPNKQFAFLVPIGAQQTNSNLAFPAPRSDSDSWLGGSTATPGRPTTIPPHQRQHTPPAPCC